MRRKAWLQARGLGIGMAMTCVTGHGTLPRPVAPARVTRTEVLALDDIPWPRTIDELAISHAGRWAAYIEGSPPRTVATGPGHVTILDLTRRRVWTLSVPGRPRALTWTPGGPDVLAFLASGDDGIRIWRYSPLHPDSAARSLTACDSIGGEILAFAWNPAGTAMAYVAAEPTTRPLNSETPPAVPRLVVFRDSSGEYTGPTSPPYSRDTSGAYVAVQEIQRGCARVLARHLVSAKNDPTISWSHGGMLLVNGAAVDVSWLEGLNSGLVYIIDVGSGMIRSLEPEHQARRRALWSPSGQLVAELRLDFLPGGRPPLTRYSLQVESPTASRRTIAFDEETDGLSYSLPPVWGGDDRTVFIARYRRATARLFAVDLIDGEWRPLTPDTLSVSRYAVSRDGRVLLAVLENVNQPQRIFQAHLSTGDLRPTVDGMDQPAQMPRGHVSQVEWRSRDQRFVVHGFLVTPPRYDSTRRYPLIVLVHGGPGHLFTNDYARINFSPWHIPAQMLASAGYMVLLPNPRGDPSYGEEFQRALHADWGPGPFSDIDAGVDALIARGLVDSSEVGIAGASYGGYLAAFAITRTGRFKAASIDDAPVDLTSEYGQNYATRSAWDRATFDGTPWTRPDVYRSQSPITYISRVRTPVIMRYGGRSSTDDDIRQSYMLAQGFELYAGLRDAGVPVEFILHPDQGHGITDRELYGDWVGRNIGWFNHWVLDARSNRPPAPR